MSLLPQNGLWWNTAATGQGFFIEYNPNSGNLLMAANNYTDAGPEEWFITTGPFLNGSYNGTLNGYTNGQTLIGPYKTPVAAGSVGTINLTLIDQANATLTWPGGVIPITRYNIIPGGLAAPVPPNTPQTGFWWNPAESGRIFIVEIQAGELSIGLGCYNNDGTTAAYGSVGPMTSLDVYSGTWFQLGGGPTFDNPTREPTLFTNTDAGSLSITWSTPTNAMLTLPTSTIIPITRLTF